MTTKYKAQAKRRARLRLEGRCVVCARFVEGERNGMALCVACSEKERVRQKTVRWAAVVAYGARCACCGEVIPAFLALDHPGENGAEERRIQGLGNGGISDAYYLKRLGYPPGLRQVLCHNCNNAKARNGGICPHQGPKGDLGSFGVGPRPRQTRARNLDRSGKSASWRDKMQAKGLCVCGREPEAGMKTCRICLEKAAQEVQELKAIVVAKYGGRCSCCLESDIRFLCVDHINNDAKAQRRDRGLVSYASFLRDIIRRGFPKDLTILCFNCNIAKQIEGACPHSKEVKSDVKSGPVG